LVKKKIKKGQGLDSGTAAHPPAAAGIFIPSTVFFIPSFLFPDFCLEGEGEDFGV